MTEPTSPPLLHIVRGDPTPEELAALITVVAVRAAATETPAPRMSDWADPTAALRRPVPVRVGAWAASGRAPGVRTRADW